MIHLSALETEESLFHAPLSSALKGDTDASILDGVKIVQI
jgi:hypothetical protein